MRRVRMAWQALRFGVVCLLVIGLAPAVLLAGEMVNRHYLGPVAGRRNAVSRATRHRRLGPVVTPFLANPVWIALTAPARWVIDHLRPLAGRGRGGRRGPPSAGVREPRRPKPSPPAEAVALPEPRWPA